MTEQPEKHYANRLTMEQTFVLNEAIKAVNEAYSEVSYGCFHVGSSLTRKDYNDVDVRCIVDPVYWTGLFGVSTDVLENPRLMFMNVAISGYLRERTGLPIDFQFQHMHKANKEFPSGANGPHKRNALGSVMARVSNVLRTTAESDGATGYTHYCPGCKGAHYIRTKSPRPASGENPVWTFNGNVDQPTFSPSIRIPADPKAPTVCHYHVIEGMISYCPDSPHALSGKKLPLPPIEF